MHPLYSNCFEVPTLRAHLFFISSGASTPATLLTAIARICILLQKLFFIESLCTVSTLPLALDGAWQ
ncbi:hypothetical protein LguiA_021929 [Lonicera macranthoides]